MNSEREETPRNDSGEKPTFQKQVNDLLAFFPKQQQMFPLDFTNRSVAKTAVREILLPYEVHDISYEDAIRKWQQLHRKQPTPEAAIEVESRPAPKEKSAEGPNKDSWALAETVPIPAGPEKVPSDSVTTRVETVRVPAEEKDDAPAAEETASIEPKEAADVADSGDAAEEPQEAEPAAEPAPMEPIKPQWKNIDPPEDDPDYVPNETHTVGASNDWKIVGASVRGKSHAHKGTFRDDAFHFVDCGDWTLVAVSDGAGSSPLSRVASQIACDHSIKSLQSTLSNYHISAPAGDMDAVKNDLTRLRSFLVESARAAQDAVMREAGQRNLSARDMYCTLLVMTHVKWGDHEVVAAIQVGDGAIGVLCRDENNQPDCTVLGDADHGEYSSETRFLTTPGIEREFANRVKFTVKKKIECIGVMSDGVSDDFFPEEDRLVQLFCGDPIAVEGMKDQAEEPVQGVVHSILSADNSDSQIGPALANWLQYEKRGSFDDRTLVLLSRERS